MIYSLSLKGKNLSNNNKVKSSPSEITNSPSLIQNKLKEKITEQVIAKQNKNANADSQNKNIAKPDAAANKTKRKSDKSEKNKNSDNQVKGGAAKSQATVQTKTKSGKASKRTTDSTVTATTTPVDPNEQYYITKNIQCNTKNCRPPNAVCSDASTCRCLPGYANFVKKDQANPGYYCNYEQKKQLVAFLLEMFLGLGVGHFYTGRVLFGVFKLLVLIGPLILGVLMCCSTLVKSSDTSSCVGLFVMIGSCLCICTALVWQLVDLIMFGINSYKDGNGVPLAHW